MYNVYMRVHLYINVSFSFQDVSILRSGAKWVRVSAVYNVPCVCNELQASLFSSSVESKSKY